MIFAKYLKGNVLPAVLVIGTVMLLGVLICIDLYDMKWRLTAGNYAELQRSAWVESGVLLYRTDSTLWDKSSEGYSIKLFEDSEQSSLKLTRRNWGLYEIVSVETYDKKLQRQCIMGYNVDTTSVAALYMCDNNQALTLTGNSNLKGLAYLPASGVLYDQIASSFYSGRNLDHACMRRSSTDLPICDTPMLSELLELKNSRQVKTLNETSLKVSFKEDTHYIKTDEIYGGSIKGNVIVYSDDCIDLYSTTYVEDALLFAPKIKIHDGFRGSLQIISSDSVIIGSDVVLNYPSGIFFPEGKSESYIEIGIKSQLNGYVVFCQKEKSDEEKFSPHYFQNDSTRVRGLVWIDGVSQIHGSISGSLYCTNLNYYTPEGFYQNVLHNAKIYGTNAMAYPLWLKSDNKKKMIKWVG